MNYKLIIFDLDGTLIDSLADITDSFNDALIRCGRQTLTLEQVRRMIGKGVLNFLKQALGEDTPQTMFDDIHTYFLEHYMHNLSSKTYCYPGITDLLGSINSGRKMAVLSNKNTEFILPVLRTLGIDGYFSVYLGGNNPYGKKPSPAAVRIIMDQFQVTPDKTILIGDMPVDIETARNAGISSCAVCWGYGDRDELARHNPDYTVVSPDELTGLL